MKTQICHVLVVVCLLGATACSTDDSATQDQDVLLLDTGGSDLDVPDFNLDQCTANFDCQGGEVCREGFCRESCGEDDPCGGDLAMCDAAAGFCVQCLETTDCSDGRQCDDTFCVFVCQSDDDCIGGLVCGRGQQCIESQCEDDRDCSGGFRCDDNVCVEIIDLVCTPNEITCPDGAAGDASVCSDNGGELSSDDCGEGDVCVDEFGCIEVICTADQATCTDDGRLSICDSTGTEIERVACDDDEYCDGGDCYEQVCTPDEVSCVDATMFTCDEFGGSMTSRACADLDDCAESDFGCGCRRRGGDWDCVPLTCRIGSARCVGNSAQECGEDGFGYDDPVACHDEEVCAGGACVPDSCQFGDSFCANTTLLECDEGGASYTETDCADSGRFCEEDDDGASCVDQLCEPESASCDDDTTRLVCNLEGSATDLQPCDDDMVCFDGACLLEVCNIDGEPECRSGDVYVCSDTGSAWALSDNCQGRGCDDGICAPPPLCEPEQTRCRDLDTVEICNDDGSAWITSRSCGDTEQCLLGDCVPECSGASEMAGCDFWAVQLDNQQTECESFLDCFGSGATCDEDRGICSDSAILQPSWLVVINHNDTTVTATLEYGESDGSDAQLIAAGGSHTFVIDGEPLDATSISERAYHLTSSAAVSAFQFNNGTSEASFSIDGTQLQPARQAGLSFVVVGVPTTPWSDTVTSFAEIVIIAVDPAGTTEVFVDPSVSVPAGDGVPFIPTAGTTIDLDYGEVLVLRTDALDDEDFTGTEIQSNRPVLVFSAHECANVPSIDVGYCDHLEEQLPPLERWGTEFYVGKSSARGTEVDYYVVVAAETGTNLETDPAIDGADGEEMGFDPLFFNTSEDFQLIADGPIVIAQLIAGSNESGVPMTCNDGLTGVGDPAFMLVPPASEYRNAHAVVVPNGLTQNYVSIFAPIATVISVDGGEIEVDFDEIEDTGYGVGIISFSPGDSPLPLLIEGDLPFGAQVYGYACDVSYAYTSAY